MRVLLVVHGYPPDAAGGTEIYTHDLAVALAADPALSVFVMTRDRDPRRPDGEVRRESRERVTVLRINNTFASCTSFEATYRHPVVLSAAAALLAEIDPDIAHVQHLTCLSTDLIAQLKDRGVPVVLTLHDFWMLCHRGQLVGLDGRRCDGPVGGSCDRCVSSSATLGAGAYRGASLLRAIPGAAIAVSTASRFVDALARDDGVRATATRLAHMRSAIARCDLVLSPSATVRDRFAASGMPTGRMAPWTLGIGFTPVARAERDPAAPLRLGFVGSFLPSKAPDLLIEAAARLPAGSVTVDLAGAPVDYHGDDSYRRRLTPWLTHPVVRRHGVVPHDRMPHHLSEIDVLVLPSIWLENSPLVIKEAFAAGAPVVASRLGGMAGMIRDGIDGLLFAPGDPAALANCLGRLVHEPDLVCRLQRGIIAPLAIEQDAAALLGHYRRLAEAARTARLSPPAARPRVGAVVLNYRTPQQTWLAVRSLQASFSPPEWVVVVDNGSGDGSAAALRAMLDDSDGPRRPDLLDDTDDPRRPDLLDDTDDPRRPDLLDDTDDPRRPDLQVGRSPGPVAVVETGRNLGFSGGCNAGISAVLDHGADWVLLVNSDAVLAPDALPQLLAAARAHPSAGIFAPLVLSRAEPDLISSAGISYSASSGRMRNLLAGRAAVEAPAVPVTVSAASGCVMLMRREVLERTGPFDASYFYSFEDVDFCLRAQAAGFSTLSVPAARAYHEGGQSIGRRSARRIYFATRNHLKLAARLESRLIRRTLTGGAIVALNAAYVVTSADAPLLSGLAAVARGTWHHLLGRYGSDAAA